MDSDEKRFGKLMRALAGAFRVELGTESFDAYWSALQAVPIDALARAVATSIDTCEYLPTVATLRGLCGREHSKQKVPPYMAPYEPEPWTCARHRGWPDSPTEPHPNCHLCQREPERERQIWEDVPKEWVKPTDAECMESCYRNADEAAERAAALRKRYRELPTGAHELSDLRLAVRRAVVEEAHWRDMARYYHERTHPERRPSP